MEPPNSLADEESLVKVVVRCRPMSRKELDDRHKPIVELEPPNRVIVHNPKEFEQVSEKKNDRSTYSHEYEFNNVFGPESEQKDIYDSVCKPLIGNVLKGYNGTIFVYGQTGTGKTYTMEGCISSKSRDSSRSALSKNDPASSLDQSYSSSNIDPDDTERQGIIPRAFKQIFDYVASETGIQFLIRASYLEIYQEEIRDLLRRDDNVKLELHETPDGMVFVKNLTAFVCKSKAEIERLMRIGNQNRITGATDMNERSSRSHAIFMITIEQQRQLASSSTREVTSKNMSKKSTTHLIRVGKLSLVDLAGSERQRKTNSRGQRQKESIKINLSLSALGNVINSLMDNSSRDLRANKKLANDGSDVLQSKTSRNNVAGFVPYRDSKLTRLLQDSLGGNAKTLMIANIGPASYNYDETVNTLSYASRAKYIRNRPKLNEDPKDALLRELQQEINKLKAKLSEHSPSSPRVQSGQRDSRRVKDELDELKQKLASLESKLLNRCESVSFSSDTESTNPSELLQGYTREQEIELERSRNELVDQSDREEAIRVELGRHEQVESLVKRSYGSKQQEMADKKRLIKQVLLSVKSLRDDIESSQQSYRLELDELDQLQYNLQKELKLKCLIMDNFIPNLYVDQVLPRIVYDEKRNHCSIRPLELALDRCIYEANTESSGDGGDQAAGRAASGPRICSEFERTGATVYPNSMRFRGENLIESKLEVPELEPVQRLRNVVQGQVDNQLDYMKASDRMTTARIQTLLDEALSIREPDIVI